MRYPLRMKQVGRPEPRGSVARAIDASCTTFAIDVVNYDSYM